MGRQNRPINLDESRGESFTLTWNNTLSYAKQFERHNINAVAGTEFISNYESSIGASRQRYDYTNDTFRYLDFGGTEVTYAGFLSEVGDTVTLIAMSDMNGYDGLYFVQ